MKHKELQKVKDQVNKVGCGFCAAKWYNSTIWLSNGRTASCHHPEAHYIPPREVFKNHKAIHNTEFKKQRRKEMLEGKRPEECTYCWAVEDADPDAMSDRVFKSSIYTPEEIEAIKNIGWDEDVNPKTLEISFDNLCNLSCSYCNPEFSTTWANDIKTNGIYEGMKTAGGGAYQNDGDHAHSFGLKGHDGNLFTKAFFKWFDDGLKEDLQELRVTGGEPTRSPHFWKLVDKCEGEKFNFAINSNLILEDKMMDKLIDASKKFQTFDLYTSCETAGKHAELIRHGFKYNTWKRNLVRFAKEGNYRHISIMMTISNLTLFSITDFLDDMIDLKREFSNKALFHMTLNILRFPSFQSVTLLPEYIKQERIAHLTEWLEAFGSFLTDSEKAHIQRLITYLQKINRAIEDTDTVEDKQADFVKFFSSYTKRRDIDIVKTIDNAGFTKWWEEMNEATT
tara:strand:+ start:8093 stop:9448 length:1356 start_codon:yes stop_codon:yes gene_type:complete